MRANRSSTDFARSGRPGELRPRAGSPADRQLETWRAPFRWVQSELRATANRLAQARRAIDAGERFLGNRRLENQRHLRELQPIPNLERCLINATNRLIRGQRAITHTLAQIVRFPDGAIVAAAAVYMAQTELHALLWETGQLILRAEDLLAATRAASGPGARLSLLVTPDEQETDPATDRRGSDAAAIPAYPPYRRPLGNAVSAARRVCRGRAPPALSFPSR